MRFGRTFQSLILCDNKVIQRENGKVKKTKNEKKNNNKNNVQKVNM